jgi:trehalose-phosphatase
LQPSGEYEVGSLKQKALDALLDADEWSGQVESLGGRCERKPGGIAFHWRGLDNGRITGIRERIFNIWCARNLGQDLSWHDFDGGIELRVVGRDKGEVIRTIAAEMPPETVFAYLGDDLTDENAFKAMPAGGAALLVRPQFRPTAAHAWMRPPQELIEFLIRWREATVTA